MPTIRFQMFRDIILPNRKSWRLKERSRKLALLKLLTLAMGDSDVEELGKNLNINRTQL